MKLVLDDRTAKGPAEIVDLQGPLGLAGLLQEVVGRGQLLVPSEVVGAPVELVRTATGDDVHLRSGGSAELGAVAVPVHLELVDGVHGGKYQDGPVRADVVVVGAIHGPHVVPLPAAAHRELDVRHEAPVLRVEAVTLAHAGHERTELQEVAAVER